MKTGESIKKILERNTRAFETHEETRGDVDDFIEDLYDFNDTDKLFYDSYTLFSLDILEKIKH